MTDAPLVLGRLAPGPYAGGAVSLDLESAETALRKRLAEPLGIGMHEVAIGVIRLVEQNLLQAVERISTERGRDPAHFVLVACGGAGPMHGAAVGRRLGARRVLVPRLAGVFCALGMLNADVGQDFARVFIARLDENTVNEARRVYAALEDDARAWLHEGGFEAGAMRFEHEADLRYAGQQWDVRVAGAQVNVRRDAKGRIRRHYRAQDIATPDEKIESLPDSARLLKPGVSFEAPDAFAHAHSDLDAAREVLAERDELFRTLGRKWGRAAVATPSRVPAQGRPVALWRSPRRGPTPSSVRRVHSPWTSLTRCPPPALSPTASTEPMTLLIQPPPATLIAPTPTHYLLSIIHNPFELALPLTDTPLRSGSSLDWKTLR